MGFNMETCSLERTAKKYALCSTIRFNVKTIYGRMFPGVTPHAIEICPFYGVENEEEADGWIRRYELWATQEKLNHKQKLQLVLLALFDAAYIWARDLDLEKVKWVAFWHLFRERYVGDPTPWPGNKMKSYPTLKRSQKFAPSIVVGLCQYTKPS
jgi:hypothetical protein